MTKPKEPANKPPKPDHELFSRPRMDGGKDGLLDKILDWLVGAGESKER